MDHILGPKASLVKFNRVQFYMVCYLNTMEFIWNLKADRYIEMKSYTSKETLS
jgi:hypothetical protein